MAKRRSPVKVVIDTNVFVGNFLSRSRRSPNRRVIRLWLGERRIRLALSNGILEEYLDVFGEVLGFDDEKLDAWRLRFGNRRICEVLRPRTESTISRDPKDNIFLDVAQSAKAGSLITNDRDLLDIAEADKKLLRFEIVTPKQFLGRWPGPT